jgi:D-amino-acid oxidase
VPAPIAILGSGVSALTTALTLIGRARHDLTIYADRAAAPTASLVAPAMFTPYAPADTPTFRRRTELSFRTFSELTADHSSGVRLGELREYDYHPDPRAQWLDALFRNRSLAAPPPVARATTGVRPHIDMLRYVPWLETQAREAGVRFQTLLAPSFDAIFARGHDTIINCTGLGSRTLAGDQLLKPMHGQVIHCPNDIGLDYSIHDDAPNGLVGYVFNFGDHLVLGGTFEMGREDSTPDEPALGAIVDRCRNLLRLDGHPRWADLARTRLQARAAPRPSRGRGDVHEDIRLEREDLPGGRTIVHNYGHGRTGVTLSWGCAAEAADLALGARQ